MKDDRGPWYLLTGLLIGLALGVLYSWGVQPVEYIDTSPASLQDEYKDHYRAMVAAAYLANNDIVRARARLGLLQDEDMYRAVAEQAQRTLAENNAASDARALGLLALALGQSPLNDSDNPPQPSQPTDVVTETLAASPTFSPSPTPSATPTTTPTVADTPTNTLAPTQSETAVLSLTIPAEDTPNPEISQTPTETPIPRPTNTPTRTPTITLTPGSPFVLLERQKVCEQAYEQPLIQIMAYNASGQPVPGVLVIVTWSGGEERFYTGLKPEKGLGYADFSPLPGVAYTVKLEVSGIPATNLRAAECLAADNSTFWGAWALEFMQP